MLLSSAHLGRDWAAAGLVMAQGGGLFPNLTVPTWARHKIGNAGNWASRVPEVCRSAALSRCLKCTYFEVILTAMVEGLLSFIFLIILIILIDGRRNCFQFSQMGALTYVKVCLYTEDSAPGKQRTALSPVMRPVSASQV